MAGEEGGLRGRRDGTAADGTHPTGMHSCIYVLNCRNKGVCFLDNFSHQTCDQIIMILILPPFTFNENLDNKANIYTEVDD